MQGLCRGEWYFAEFHLLLSHSVLGALVGDVGRFTGIAKLVTTWWIFKARNSWCMEVILVH